ncbi:MAG TPA: PAS domain S-box protein [Rhizomicrobium sp.]|jgi:PAS domain S-box-containing protein|nr:PAS domain S-box protein [Rhizomicrobium sp.]
MTNTPLPRPVVPPLSEGGKPRTPVEAALHLAAVVQDSNDAILTKDLDGIITSWNRAAERLYGYTAEEIVGLPVAILIPANRVDEGPSILKRLRLGERIEHYETVRQRKDGSLVDISLTVSPLRDSSGVIIGASKVARDIGERKRAAEQQELLLGEMQHRTKNLLAVIEAIARQSWPRDEPAVDAYLNDLMARLRALFSSSELIIASSARRPSILDIARASLAPFMTSGRPDAIALGGSNIFIPETTAVGLALAFHELATNALKYGALKSPRGRVSLTCRAETLDDSARVYVAWKETGGETKQEAPTRTGFGTRVIEAAMNSERDGTVNMNFEPDGFHCCFQFVTTASAVPPPE